MTDAYRISQLDAQVLRLRANLCDSDPQPWEIAAAVRAEVQQLRLRVVGLNAMLNDVIDELYAAECALETVTAQLGQERTAHAATRATAGKRHRVKTVPKGR